MKNEIYRAMDGTRNYYVKQSNPVLERQVTCFLLCGFSFHLCIYTHVCRAQVMKLEKRVWEERKGRLLREGWKGVIKYR